MFYVLESRVWLLGTVVAHHFCCFQDVFICGNPVLKYLSCEVLAIFNDILTSKVGVSYLGGR